MVFSCILDAEFCPNFLSVGVILIVNIIHMEIAIECLRGSLSRLLKLTPGIHILIWINFFVD